MTSSITLKVATVTSAVTFAKTDSDVAQVLRWFIKDKATPPPEGLTQGQLNQYYLDAARDEIVRYVRQEAQRVRLAELRAAEASLADTAAQETAI